VGFYKNFFAEIPYKSRELDVFQKKLKKIQKIFKKPIDK
jgi:hypothetical protein